MGQNRFILLLIISFTLVFFSNFSKKNSTIQFVSNPDLKTVAGIPGWKGTPMEDGKYKNLYHPFESSLWDVLKWKLSPNPQKEEKKKDDRRLPVDFDPSILEGKNDYLIWMGHATFLMRINGITILTDPVLMDNFFLKRKSELPIPIEKIPPLDYIMISHTHRDHCDKNTIQTLSENHPGATFLVGLSMKDLLNSWIDGHQIQEAGWFQQYDLGDLGLKITYLPSRHWSRRGLFDQNEMLWGGYYIQSGEKSIYFMGDSGYGIHFQDIQKIMGSPQYCIMGVGAYKPEWFMAPSHISPTDAITAFNEMKGKYFIPMHFGTFDLTDEPMLEPLDVLIENSEAINGKLIKPVLGQNLLR